MGYNVKTKPLKYIAGETKGDIDVDLTVDIFNLINDIDAIVMFSGDSDYLSAVKKFHDLGKFIRIYSFKNLLSWELKDFAIKNTRCNYVILDRIKDKIERD